jgi:hypothetical protein
MLSCSKSDPKDFCFIMTPPVYGIVKNHYITRNEYIKTNIRIERMPWMVAVSGYPAWTCGEAINSPLLRRLFSR